MAAMWLFGVVAILTVSSTLSRPAKDETYDGYKVIQVSSAADRKAFSSIITSLTHDFDVDVWSKSALSADVMIAPSDFAAFKRAAVAAGMRVAVKIDNVQRMLDREFNERKKPSPAQEPDIEKTYLTHSEINTFLDTITSTTTAADVSQSFMGNSYQGRAVNYVKIEEKTEGTKREKYAIVIDGGLHAREWTSVAVALNTIQKLTLNPENDPEVQEMLEKFDWYIAPVTNPDGYDYSHGAGRRLWRKSRNNQYSSSCPGVDLNRNFGYEWNPDRGGSRNPCSDVYSGPSGFSEPETQNIRDWLTGLQDRARLYLNVHAYGEYMLYPYGWDPNAPREEEELMIAAGDAFANAMIARGRPYIVGNSAEVFYIAAGGADDYAKGGLGISLSYTPELSPNDNDVGGNWQAGFILPESQIKDVVDDTFEGLKAMARRVFDEYGYP